MISNPEKIKNSNDEINQVKPDEITNKMEEIMKKNLQKLIKEEADNHAWGTGHHHLIIKSGPQATSIYMDCPPHTSQEQQHVTTMTDPTPKGSRCRSCFQAQLLDGQWRTHVGQQDRNGVTTPADYPRPKSYFEQT